VASASLGLLPALEPREERVVQRDGEPVVAAGGGPPRSVAVPRGAHEEREVPRPGEPERLGRGPLLSTSERSSGLVPFRLGDPVLEVPGSDCRVERREPKSRGAVDADPLQQRDPRDPQSVLRLAPAGARASYRFASPGPRAIFARTVGLVEGDASVERLLLPEVLLWNSSVFSARRTLYERDRRHEGHLLPRRGGSLAAGRRVSRRRGDRGAGRPKSYSIQLRSPGRTRSAW